MICCRLRQTALPGTLAAGSLLTQPLVSDVIQLQGSGYNIIYMDIIIIMLLVPSTEFLVILPLCPIYQYFRNHPSAHSEKSLILVSNPFHNHSFFNGDVKSKQESILKRKALLLNHQFSKHSLSLL